MSYTITVPIRSDNGSTSYVEYKAMTEFDAINIGMAESVPNGHATVIETDTGRVVATFVNGQWWTDSRS